MESIEKGLTLALESPDPVVRNLAIRREEIQREMGKLDNFLGAYAELSAGRPIESLKPRPQVRTAPSVVSRPPVDFGVEALDIITAHGQPMSFNDFRAIYADRHGAEPEQNLRKRLKRRDDIIRTVEGRGLWPVNQPVPGGDNGAVAAH
jgi:hypothetical protein